jgi:hypothetical protein
MTSRVPRCFLRRVLLRDVFLRRSVGRGIGLGFPDAKTELAAKDGASEIPPQITFATQDSSNVMNVRDLAAVGNLECSFDCTRFIVQLNLNIEWGQINCRP